VSHHDDTSIIAEFAIRHQQIGNSYAWQNTAVQKNISIFVSIQFIFKIGKRIKRIKQIILTTEILKIRFIR
jgi:hypothetical protein